MQFRKQYRHLWFVFLMIFFIGGSSAAVAAVQELHSHHSSTVSSLSCHDQQMMQHHPAQSSQADRMSPGQCHDGQMQDHLHCQDCNSTSHCQSINFALDQNTPSLSASPFLELSTHIHADYQARHLAGYWQEILRPPRT
ncbi:hypothetical protein ACNQO6_13625 [Acinetobacter calcoaceticus]|uniref:hypothetical protein n=1 Tax=Acinetobacter calcoaceticus TaxID=471 RepID=UPI002B2B3376|nr:hypothetical protein SB581_03520 [Acinetobacter baumannii]